MQMHAYCIEKEYADCCKYQVGTRRVHVLNVFRYRIGAQALYIIGMYPTDPQPIKCSVTGKPQLRPEEGHVAKGALTPQKSGKR